MPTGPLLGTQDIGVQQLLDDLELEAVGEGGASWSFPRPSASTSSASAFSAPAELPTSRSTRSPFCFKAASRASAAPAS